MTTCIVKTFKAISFSSWEHIFDLFTLYPWALNSYCITKMKMETVRARFARMSLARAWIHLLPATMLQIIGPTEHSSRRVLYVVLCRLYLYTLVNQSNCLKKQMQTKEDTMKQRTWNKIPRKRQKKTRIHQTESFKKHKVNYNTHSDR